MTQVSHSASRSTRRQLGQFGLAVVAAASMLFVNPAALAQSKKDSAVIGMILEPTSLDPTTAPAAAIGEVVHYNILEGLTKINVDGSVTPLLAESWTMDADGKAFTFKLRKGVKFQDGSPFDSSAVKFSFERAKGEKSTNKAKGAVFNNIAHISTPDAHTVVLVLTNPDGNFLFRMGENTAVILHPNSADAAATKPIGTGPYKLDNWAKGTAVTLTKWDGYRDAANVKLKKVTFRFINDASAQVAALLAGDIDGMPRFQSPQSLKQFQTDKRFVVELGSTAGKGIMTINNKKKPFDDVRVRRALSHAIDKKAFIDGVFEGLAKPIGSHMAPTDAGYVDLTGQYAFDPEKAKAFSAQRYGSVAAGGVDEARVLAMAQQLLHAKQPVVVTSYLGRKPEAVDALQALAELCGIRVFEFSPSYLCISRASPCFAGFDPSVAMADADVGLLLDVDVPWLPKFVQDNPHTHWTQVDVDAIKKDFPMWGFATDTRMQADCATVLRQVTAKVQALADAAFHQRVAARMAQKRLVFMCRASC